MSQNINIITSKLGKDFHPINIVKKLKNIALTNPNNNGRGLEHCYKPLLTIASTALAINLKTEKVNDSENDLREIYDIDKEAFSETDPYQNYEDFIAIIRENGLSTYSIKDETNKVLGYYQIEPIKNNDLYIDSIGLKKEYRKTKTGYQAIKQAWTEIIKYAIDNNVKTLSLHANAEDKALLNMYTKMGFVVKETLPNYYENGSSAIFMVMEIPQIESIGNSTETNKEELSPEESYIKACKEAKEEFLKFGNINDANKYLELCSYLDKNGNPIFSKILSDAFLSLYKNPDLANNICNIFNALKEKDKDGNIFIRHEVLGLIKLILNKTSNIYQVTRICEKAKINEKIDTNVLYFLNYIIDKARYYIDEHVDNCFNPDGTFNQEIADYYRYCYAKGLDYFDIKNLDCVVISEKDGKKALKSYFLIDTLINKSKISDYSKQLRFYDLEKIASTKCDIENYLEKQDYIESLIKNRKYYSNEKVYIAGIISACFLKRPKSFTNEVDINSRKIMNSHLFNTFQKYEEKFIDKSDDISVERKKIIVLTKLIKACTLYDPIKGEYFDESLMEKALMLMEKGINLINASEDCYDSEIVSIIESCKKRTGSNQYECIEFDNEIFEKVLNNITPEKNKNSLIRALNFCKVKKNNYSESEVFDSRAFDLHLEIQKNQGYTNNIKDELFKKEENSPQINKRLLELVANEFKDMSISNFIEYEYDNNTGKYENYIDINEFNAYKKLKAFSERKNLELENYTILNLLQYCREQKENSRSFDIRKFNKLIEFLEKGYSIDNCNVFYNRNYRQILKLEELLNSGIELYSAREIIKLCDKNGNINPDDYKRCLELYNLGARGSDIIHWTNAQETYQEAIGILAEKKEMNELAYERLKQLISLNIPVYCFDVCKSEDKVFKDKFYKLLIDLKEKNYPINHLKSIMQACFRKIENNKIFEPNVYNKIFELEKLGIEKEGIGIVLQACRSNKNNIFSEQAYSKIPELYYKEYDTSGIYSILQFCLVEGKFDSQKYAELIKYSSNHKKMRDALNPKDADVLAKINENFSIINTVETAFGSDVLNYATSLRISGYVLFIQNCNKLLTKTSPEFIKELKARLYLLPSPELKMKRLQILSGLATKVNEDTLLPLVKMIESTNMSEEQKEIINRIFSNKNTSYETKIEEFVQQLNVPAKNKDYIVNYLSKTHFDELIQRPESLEEQMKQMDIFAQQMLTNPKIPLDKKIKYIDEFKTKKADMEKSPKEYTTPRLYPKAMKEIQNLVEAYINIPNANAKFNNSIYETTYRALEIEPTKSLLENINFDVRYFNNLLMTGYGFRNNFKRLIELIKMNPEIKLTDLRMTLPAEDSELYTKYQDLGLIEQIKANLDTKRQFEEAGLNFNKWNSYDENLRGQDFNVEIDPEKEYSNLKYNLSTEIQGELIKKISKKEYEDFVKALEANDFSIENKEILYTGVKLTNGALEKIIDIIIKYSETNEYWKTALSNENSSIPEVERESLTGFIDHIKGFKKKLEDIKKGKNISNIHLKLADPNNIGRNIFFGNHVGCCNSVESSYAGYSAPQHLLNSYVRGIEIVDEFGNSYGNSLCYFANINGKITFVIDSFEANGKLASNPTVTENIVNFAKQVCKEMNCEDAEIVFGPRYNHLDLSNYTKNIVKNFKVIGTVSDITYCDSLGGINILEQINSIRPTVEIHQSTL